jgi:DNA-binding response OmpR family regulator
VDEILVVDDEWDIAEVVIYLLQSEGYRVRYALNGVTALQMLSERPADLVLTDYMMPLMNGSELVREIRSREELSHTSVILMSALPEDVVEGRVDFAATFLRKPFNEQQLLRAVRRELAARSRNVYGT